MKCLLLAPKKYPFVKSIEKGILDNGIELKTVDYLDFFSKPVNAFRSKFFSLPKKLKSPWETPYTNKVNKTYWSVFRQYKPDLVFIYNNQQVKPDLIEAFRKTARVAFMLGDNPLYTSTNIYNLHILFQADYIISPDTMWMKQLSKLGIRNIHFDSFGFNSDTYFPMEPGVEDLRRFKSDFVYVATAHKSNWGYKRALFLSQFKDFDMKAYISGGGMERWYPFFPGLSEKVIPHDRFDPGFNNLIYNCSKIAPVELVPSLFHGIHVRVFDALGAGILPLCEYSADLESTFEGIDIPLIRCYEETRGIALQWLNDEERRQRCISEMRKRVEDRFAPGKVIGRLVNQVFGGKDV